MLGRPSRLASPSGSRPRNTRAAGKPQKMNELALFAGAGGGILGGKLLGWRTVCAVEWEPYPASVLCARQNEGALPPFPIWDDVQTFDGRPWRGIVDVVSGGFPCQDISSAGKGAGIEGSRSGMWRHMARIIGEVRPRFAFIENSPLLRTRGLATVLKDLAEMGYDARWGVLGAHHAGAPHKRDRMWVLAHDANANNGTGGTQQERQYEGAEKSVGNCENELDAWGTLADANVSQCKGGSIPGRIYSENPNSNQSGAWWTTDPADAPKSDVGRVANGVAARVDRLKAIGNGQVPAVAALAWNVLKPIPERLVVHPVP
jgi:DNA (cytosine-5)-methyltransferase 1